MDRISACHADSPSVRNLPRERSTRFTETALLPSGGRPRTRWATRTRFGDGLDGHYAISALTQPRKQPASGPADEQQPKHELRLAQVGNDRELVKKVSIDNQGPNQLFDSPDCRAAQGILALKPPTAWDSDKEPAPLWRRLSTRR